MPIYEVEINGTTYEVESDSKLTDVQAYQYALQTAKSASPQKGNSNPDSPRVGALAAMNRAAQAPKPDPLAQIDAATKGQYKAPAPDEVTTGATIGGIGGNIVGGLAAAPAGPAAAWGGATLGGAVGTYIGALRDADVMGLSANDARAYALRQTGINVAWDVGGGIVFKIGGKVLGKIPAVRGAGKWIADKLGLADEAPVPKSDKVLPGRAVFEETTAAETKAAADAANKELATGAKVPTKGQITGEAPWLERATRNRAGESFEIANDVTENTVRGMVDTQGARIAGQQSKENAGAKLVQVLDTLEARVKEHAGPVFEKLAALRKGDLNIIDVRGAKAAAQAALDNAERSGAGTPALRTLHKTISERPDLMNPADLQDLLKSLKAQARDLDQPGKMDTEVAGALKKYIGDLQGSLEDGLERAARDVEQQIEMFRGGAGAGAREAASLEGSQIAERRAVDAAAEARARPEMPTGVPRQQEDMFGGANGELFPTGPAGLADTAAANANAGRAAAIARAEAEVADEATGAAGRAFGPGQQQSMLPGAPAIDPRLPQQLREVRDLYRDMAENVYSSTGSKALKAGENRGVEHIASTIYASGNTTTLRELNKLALLAERVDNLPRDAAGRLAAEKKARELGLDLVEGQSLKEATAEVQRAVRAEFFKDRLASPELIRKLPDDLRHPKIKAQFEEMFPDKADRQVIETIAQAAQITGRRPSGYEGGAAFVLLQTLVGGPVGAATYALAPTRLAHAMTEPELRRDLPKVARWLLNAAKGTAPTVAPEFVQSFMAKLTAGEGK